jgi:hypothetical protein
MEAFQEAYVRGVAAAAGCVVHGRPEIDEGVDITLTHTSETHQTDDNTVYLAIQMKSSSKGLIHEGKFASATMRRNRYDSFRAENVTVHKIVVILHMPAELEDWIRVGDDALLLHHKAYWVSIRGNTPIEPGTESAQVKAPVEQIFDDLALCRIMQRIGQGGVP